MAIRFLPQVQPQAVRPLDFSPAQRTILDARQSMDQQHRQSQNRLLGGIAASQGSRAASQAAFEQGDLDLGNAFSQSANQEDDRKMALRERAKGKISGLAQSLLDAPEEMRPQMWNRLRALDPDSEAELRAAGIDPNDYNAGARMILAEARGYQDPLDRQIKEAKLAQLRRKNASPDAAYAQRAAAAQQYGLDPNSEVGRQFILTGKLPDTTKPGFNLTPGQQAVDKKFAEELVDWNVRGGFADTGKMLEQLDGIADMLEDPAQSAAMSGPIEGMMPDRLSALMGERGQRRIATREAVEEVVQRNLRAVLGAQFTEKEGDRLIARAFNPSLSPAENARRVRRLVTQIRNVATAKQDATNYFNQHGTLQGWTGSIPTMEGFDPAGPDAPVQAPSQPPAMAPQVNPQMLQPQAEAGPAEIPLPNGMTARRAPDGNYYVPDPNRPGSFMRVEP